MSIYYNPELARLLVNERLAEAGRGRVRREGEQNMERPPRRSLLDLFRRQVPADSPC